MLRWPGQTKSWDISKMKKAWGRGMAEAGVIDNRRMGAALSQLTDKRFPPDLGALLSTATQPVNESMAEAALNKIYKVITSPYTPLYLLTREEYYCIKKIDVWELKHAPNGRLNLILKIQDILNYAINHPNILPDVPPKPAGTIEQKPNTTVIEAKKKEMFDILGIKKLPLPAK
ncbi:hypothetical protein CAP31_02655 [Sulfuriferula sp. AH1]|nr:hypothetical protein CAP31_02655 [Sulfuriferula sp. AH1]